MNLLSFVGDIYFYSSSKDMGVSFHLAVMCSFMDLKRLLYCLLAFIISVHNS